MDDKRLARIALISLLALGCVLILQPFVAPLLFAAVVCIATWPINAWLIERLRGRATLAATLMVLLLILGVLLPMALLTTSLTEIIPVLMEKLRGLMEQAQEPPQWLLRVPLVGEQLDAYWHGLAGSREEVNKLLRQLYDPTRTVLLKMAALAGEGMLQLALTLFIAFFFYRDGEFLVARLHAASTRLAGALGEQMLFLAHGTIMAVMIGIIGTAAAQSLVALIGFAIAGVPAAILLATATFFLSMIPVGPPLIWGSAAFWLFDRGETGWAIFMLLYGLLAISSVDNFVKPVLISRSASLPLLLIALGVFGGILAFGFVGIFLGPVLLALGLVLMDRWTTRSGARPGL